mmetsp:Transcript_50512/g.101611  ORF Transcript_50512/g.101611 Transcript_50512/m.101611 type:complete len:286 (+) Transcript_50512:779-1636(+)
MSDLRPNASMRVRSRRLVTLWSWLSFTTFPFRDSTARQSPTLQHTSHKLPSAPPPPPLAPQSTPSPSTREGYNCDSDSVGEGGEGCGVVGCSSSVFAVAGKASLCEFVCCKEESGLDTVVAVAVVSVAGAAGAAVGGARNKSTTMAVDPAERDALACCRLLRLAWLVDAFRSSTIRAHSLVTIAWSTAKNASVSAPSTHRHASTSSSSRWRNAGGGSGGDDAGKDTPLNGDEDKDEGQDSGDEEGVDGDGNGDGGGKPRLERLACTCRWSSPSSWSQASLPPWPS